MPKRCVHAVRRPRVAGVSAGVRVDDRALASCVAMSEPASHGLSAAPQYQELPSTALDSSRVEALWRYVPSAPCSQRVLPDGRMDLVAHAICGPDGELQRVWLAIAGPADQWSGVSVQAGMLSLGIRFCIGWGGMCLGVSPVDLRNQVLVGTPVVARLGPWARALIEARQLCELRQALESTAAALAARAEPTAGQRRALQAIAQLMRGDDAAHDIAAPQARASVRTLRRDVQQAAGLSLRTLAGVLRFQRAIALLHARATVSLADLADRAGYADQAHMTREFRRFGGFTPALPHPVPVLGEAAPSCIGAEWPKVSRRSHGMLTHSGPSIHL